MTASLRSDTSNSFLVPLSTLTLCIHAYNFFLSVINLSLSSLMKIEIQH